MSHLAASCFVVTSSQTVWVKSSSPLKLNLGSAGLGVNLSFSGSGSLLESDQGFVIGLAVFMAVAMVLTLLPYLRVMALAVIAGGGVALLIGFGALSKIRQPSGSGVLDRIGDALIQRSPGVGVYLLIIGGSLAALGGVLTLLTPRSTVTAGPMPMPDQRL